MEPCARKGCPSVGLYRARIPDPWGGRTIPVCWGHLQELAPLYPLDPPATRPCPTLQLKPFPLPPQPPEAALAAEGGYGYTRTGRFLHLIRAERRTWCGRKISGKPAFVVGSDPLCPKCQKYKRDGVCNE